MGSSDGSVNKQQDNAQATAAEVLPVPPAVGSSIVSGLRAESGQDEEISRLKEHVEYLRRRADLFEAKATAASAGAADAAPPDDGTFEPPVSTQRSPPELD